MLQYTTLFRLLRQASVITGLALFSSYATAIQFGKLRPLSSADEPFKARIYLSDIKVETIGQLKVGVWSAQNYAQANLIYNPALKNLSFAVNHDNTNVWLELSSPEPAGNQPFDLFLTLIGPDERLEGRFAVSPLLNAGSTATAPKDRPVSSHTGADSTTAHSTPPRNQAPSSSKQSSGSAQTVASRSSATVSVARGQTLYAIVDQQLDASLTKNQQLLAWQQANPHAFIQQNMNLLRAGVQLTPPSQDVLNGISVAEANRAVRSQNEAFARIRGRVQGSATRLTNVQESTGQVVTSSTSNAAPVSNEDRLRLSAGSASDQEQLTDELSAKQKELADLQARNSELEQNLNEATRLLELQHQASAATQQQLESLQQAHDDLATLKGRPWTPWLMLLGGLLGGSGLIGLVWFMFSRKKIPVSSPAVSTAADTPWSPVADEPALTPSTEPTDTSVASASQPDISFDFDLNLDADTSKQPVQDQPEVVSGTHDVSSDSMLSQNEVDLPELESQFILAQGYLEINDKEAARELLTEIQSKGSTAQRAKAQQLLDSL